MVIIINDDLLLDLILCIGQEKNVKILCTIELFSLKQFLEPIIPGISDLYSICLRLFKTFFIDAGLM